MYKQSGLLVIAALVIASMGILAPTATVSATAPTVDLTPTTVRDNAYVLFTLTVTNPSDSDNIENILIQDVSTGLDNMFGGAIFGENVNENLDNVGDNLEWIGTELAFVAENLRQTKTAILAAADALQTATNNLDNAGDKFADSGRENLIDLGSKLQTVDDYLQNIVTVLKTEPIDWPGAADNIRQAAAELENAGADLSQDDYEVLHEIGENFDNIAQLWDNQVADNLAAPNLALAADMLYDNALDFEQIYATIRDNYDNTSSATVLQGAEYLDNFAFHLKQFADNLLQAAENIRAAGDKLDNIVENIPGEGGVDASGLTSADNILALYTYGGSGEDGSELVLLDVAFIENIRLAAENLGEDNDSTLENIAKAGELLVEAARWQDQWLGTELASNIIGYDGEVTKTSARYWIAQAGYALWNNDNDNVSFTAAASALDNAAAQFTAAGTQIKAAAAELSPTTKWGAEHVSNGLLLSALDYDNDYITPGSSAKTFKFLWKAPDVSDIIESHTIRIWTFSSTGSSPENATLSQTDFTMSVDGEIPTVVITVTQTSVADYLGTAVDNLIGTVYDNGDATVTITTSKEVSSFGTMKIENFKHLDDNLELTIADFTTTDNLVFTYTFSVVGWDENLENAHWDDSGTGGPRVYIEAPCATTATGIENDQSVSGYFEVDLAQPVLVDNALPQFQNLSVMTKLGTDNEYYVTTVKRWTIAGRAEDNDNTNLNGGTTDNAKWAITTVYLNSTALTMSRLSDDNFSTTENLEEGVNVIQVKAVDRVGNEVENSLDNVYVDNVAPSVASVSVAGSTWADNTLEIGDNMPTFQLKIQDTGWGIPRDNLVVYLDNDTDVGNGAIATLENNGEWDNGVASDTYNFENTFDNNAKGLESGTYYIIVEVTDNLRDNDNWVQAFTIDVTAPTAPTSVTGNVSGGASASAREIITTTSLSFTGTAEVDSTIKIEITTDNGVTWTEDTTASITQPDVSGNWSATVTITEGQLVGIRMKAKDAAGNWGSAYLFGYVLPDSTGPTVSITSPATGATTDQATIALTGSVVKDAWESYGDLTLTVQVGTGSVSVPISSDGSFTYSVALSEGANTIVATVTDGVNTPVTTSVTVTRTVTPWATYAIIVVIVALILAAIAIFRKR